MGLDVVKRGRAASSRANSSQTSNSRKRAHQQNNSST